MSLELVDRHFVSDTRYVELCYIILCVILHDKGIDTGKFYGFLSAKGTMLRLVFFITLKGRINPHK